VSTYRDRERFEEIVAHLCAEDPFFSARVRRATPQRHRRRRRTAAWVLFVTAPIMVIIGGWTGLIVAVLAVAEGVRLLAAAGTFFPWTPGPRSGPGLLDRHPPW
jgi:hypothetical protein